jgi:hypothetical protein
MEASKLKGVIMSSIEAKALHPWLDIRPWQRHSLVLSVAGLIYIAIGMSYFVTEITPSRARALVVALELLSMKQWGVIFILSGALAIISARWPLNSRTWGYTVLGGLSAGWSAVYLTGVVLKDAPSTNLSGFGTWGLIAFLWWAISGLLNPLKVAHHAQV